jgi:transposase InsO family protein
VPGAFDEPSETIEPIETPESSETIARTESDETVEIIEQNTVRDRSTDPSEQILGELASKMVEGPRIPAYQEVAPKKLATFNTEKLDRNNVSSWKAQYKLFLRTQGCWKIVEYTYDWRDDAPRVKELLQDPGWDMLDAAAKLYILQNLKVEDKTSVQGLRTSGDMWAYLMEKYERRTQVDVTNAIWKLTCWQMDSRMSLEEVMQQLEQYHAELDEISSGEVKFNSKIINILFLDGLPSGYDSMKFSLLAQENLTRGVILSRLQQQESMMRTSANEEAASESANRTEQRKCFNCDMPGHFARDCKAPRKEKEKEHGKARTRSKDRGSRRSDKGKSRRSHRNRQKGKARTADEESDSESESDSSSGSRSSTKYSANRVYGSARRTERERNSAYRVELKERISDRYEDLIEENEEAYRADENNDPIIDSGATSHCSSRIDLFESLDQRYGGSLGTAGKSITIAGRGTMRIPLSSGKVARIHNVLYVPKVRQTLLSTQVLQDMGVWNEHVRKEYRFFKRRGDILAEGYNIGRTSYLGWVGRRNALATGLGKPEEEAARLVKQVDWELLHRRLGHPGKARFKLMAKKMGLTPEKGVLEDLKSCETCIQAKSFKQQSHKEVPRASRPLKRVYMDFWGPYNSAKTLERYYLSLTDDCTRFSWIFLTKDREATTVKATLEAWLAMAEREKGVKLLIIRTDNAKEFKALEPWALKKGIQIEFTEPGTPQQNGVAERLN